jgi:hypothetical protein
MNAAGGQQPVGDWREPCFGQRDAFALWSALIFGPKNVETQIVIFIDNLTQRINNLNLW